MNVFFSERDQSLDGCRNNFFVASLPLRSFLMTDADYHVSSLALENVV